MVCGVAVTKKFVIAGGMDNCISCLPKNLSGIVWRVNLKKVRGLHVSVRPAPNALVFNEKDKKIGLGTRSNEIYELGYK